MITSDPGLNIRLENVGDSATRREAARRTLESGLPGIRSENWKYTRLGGLAPAAWAPLATLAEGQAVAQLAQLDKDLPLAGPRLVWANGTFRPELSRLADLPKGIEFRALESNDQQDLLARWIARPSNGESHPLDTVNAALFSTGCRLHVAAGVHCDTPLSVVFLHGPAAEPGTVQVRNLIELEAGAEISLVECSLGSSPGGTTTQTMEWTLAAGARAHHLRVQAVGGESLRVTHLFAALEEDARLVSTTISLAGERIRNESRVTLNGLRADGVLCGLGLLEGSRHLDSHTWMDHAVPDGTSHQLFKHVLDDASRAVFTGHILVRPDAQHTDAVQNSASLLVSDDARANSRPQLEIYADDVKCTHGATVGHLEEEGLFYLRSRGIDGDTARRLLVRAFAQAVVEDGVHTDLQPALGTWVQRHFENDGN